LRQKESVRQQAGVHAAERTWEQVREEALSPRGAQKLEVGETAFAEGGMRVEVRAELARPQVAHGEGARDVAVLRQGLRQ
jgi:hypothetical protein